jgi:hypothetical protein
MVPPVKLGRRVDANGARPVERLIALETRDFGNEERSYLKPGVPWEGEELKRRTADAKALFEYQRLVCLRKAAGWIG